MILYDNYCGADKKHLQKKTILLLFIGWLFLLVLLIVVAPKQYAAFNDLEINTAIPIP